MAGATPARGGTAESADAAAKVDFKARVTRHFEELTASGRNPNEAAARALQLAAGTAARPLDLPAFLASVEQAKCSRNFGPVIQTIDGVFASADALNSSFLLPAARRGGGAAAAAPAPGGGASPGVSGAQPRQSTNDYLGIDFQGIRRAYEALSGLGEATVESALDAACDRLLDALLKATSVPAAGPALLRQVLILLENPLLMDPDHHGLLCKLSHVVSALPSAVQNALILSFQTYTKDQTERLVSVLQSFLTIQLYEGMPVPDAERGERVIESATRLLSLLHAANDKTGAIDFKHFYNEALNRDDFDIKEDYRRWKHPERYSFSFCKYPFLYDPASKSRILQLESTMRMSHEFEDAVLRSIFIGATCPYLVLKVRREFLIQDTLHQIQRRPDDLRKPLKVHFYGEEGVDEGGVQKEFFQLLIRQIFDPDYGMFSYDDDTRLFWFSGCASQMDFEMEREYELIGVVLGLAIYNGHILEFRFPMLTYKKLLGHVPTIEDMREVSPDVYRGLKQLLEFEGDVRSSFGLYFQASQEYLGEVTTVDLVKGGANRAVTKDNRQDYVDLYTRWYLDTSIKRQFSAFQRGFVRMCGGPVLSLFRSEELEQLICGSPLLDFEALEARTVYDDGYTKEDPVIESFWRVVHAMTDEDKKKLLFFATGSDRVPIRGLASLPFVISKNGTGDERLPTAHTCFNHLLLPAYSSDAVMEERLTLAIMHNQGFQLQ